VPPSPTERRSEDLRAFEALPRSFVVTSGPVRPTDCDIAMSLLSFFVRISRDISFFYLIPHLICAACSALPRLFEVTLLS